MTDTEDRLVIGLTGSFGSGCSTLAEALEKKHGFTSVALSTPIRDRWKSEHPRARKPAHRDALQDIGNQIRQTDGPHALAEAALARVEAGTGNFVIDGIKNESEVEHLRRNLSTFFLVAVQATQDQRWERVRSQYDSQGQPYADFEQDDLRDQAEELPYGQQVQLCVDDADIVVNNEEYRQARSSAVKALADAMQSYLGLVTQEKLCGPGTDEIMMSMAYSQAKASMCLKRHVGAVIADWKGTVVAAGYNENPESMKPCYEEFGYCHKDAKVHGGLEALTGTMCPDCGKKIVQSGPPFGCTECGLGLRAKIFPDRGMRWCTALHAEERALTSAASQDLHNSTLYSTTFPCSNCARQIAHRGIKKVVYVEPYPDKEGLWYFELNDVEVTPFEGVKARAFERLFRPFRRELEERYELDGKPAK